MRVLVACEESQAVCIAFRDRGHEAYSCDILPCSGGHPEWHLVGDMFNYTDRGWDILIAHPPCTYLSNAGIRWFNEERYGDKAVERKRLRDEALEFIMKIATLPIDKIAIENPTGWINSHWRKPDQTIQPYQFGDPESKRTHLWLKNLPKLVPTNIVEPKIYGYYKTGKNTGKPIYGNNYLKFSEDRGMIRSKTFKGIAEAMASQWGNL